MRVMTICAIILLAAGVGGLEAGDCTLQCKLPSPPSIVAYEGTGRNKGVASFERGEWFPVVKRDGRWNEVLEQEPQQCARGAAA